MFAIDNYDFTGKRAIIRVDFNVPLNGEGQVTDDTRIRAAIPTIKKVLEKGGAVILMSHLGRPKKNPDPKFSLEQIIPAIEARLGVKIQFAGDCMGEKAAEMAKNLKAGEVMLLENLRFYAEEEGKPRGLAEDATDEENSFVFILLIMKLSLFTFLNAFITIGLNLFGAITFKSSGRFALGLLAKNKEIFDAK